MDTPWLWMNNVIQKWDEISSNYLIWFGPNLSLLNDARGVWKFVSTISFGSAITWQPELVFVVVPACAYATPTTTSLRNQDFSRHWPQRKTTKQYCNQPDN